MWECKCCKILKKENEYLRELVNQLLLQIAPKPDPTDMGAFPVDENVEEEIDINGHPVGRESVGI